MARHPGFLPFPTHAPTMLLALDQVIQREAERFLTLAEAEVERSRSAYLRGFEPELWPRVERDLRCELRMDALALVATAGSDDDGAPDPVLAAIAASRRAEAEIRLAYAPPLCCCCCSSWGAHCCSSSRSRRGHCSACVRRDARRRGGQRQVAGGRG